MSLHQAQQSEPDDGVAETFSGADEATPIVPITAHDLLSMDIAPREMLMAHYKHMFERPRPQQLAPGLLPAVEVGEPAN